MLRRLIARALRAMLRKRMSRPRRRSTGPPGYRPPQPFKAGKLPRTPSPEVVEAVDELERRARRRQHR